jgi:hypothetical protein
VFIAELKRSRLGVPGLRAAALALVLGCGGGRVDPGFGEPPGEPLREATPSGDTQRLTEGKPAVVVIRSETCGPCKRAERALLPALAPFRNDIDLIVLDVTDEAAEASSLETARAVGVLDFFLARRGVTPSIALVSRHGHLRLFTGNTFGRRTWERTFAAMAADEEP